MLNTIPIINVVVDTAGAGRDSLRTAVFQITANTLACVPEKCKIAH